MIGLARRLASFTRASSLAAFGIIAALAILVVWEVWVTVDSRRTLDDVTHAKELSDQYQQAAFEFSAGESLALTIITSGDADAEDARRLGEQVDRALASVMRITELGDANDRALVQRLLDEYTPALRMLQALIETGNLTREFTDQGPSPEALSVTRTEFQKMAEQRKAEADAGIADYRESQDVRLGVTAALGGAGILLVFGLVVALRHYGKREAKLAAIAASQPQLEAARDQADRANRAKSEFLSRMSHELRTPMNAVLGFGQLLEMDDLTPEQRENLSYIMSSGKHLLGLIDEVLDISRIESGRLSLSIERISLRQVVSDVVEMTAPLAADRGITVVVETANVDTPAIADVQRTKQVLLNLVSNAIKYNKPGGWVTIAVCRESVRHASVSVTDTGNGVPEDKLERVFSPFDRLGAESTSIQGTGLGLALSKALAEAMNGTLGVRNAPEAGATFTLTLPAPGESSVSATPAMAPCSGGDCGKVVCIEDNYASSELLAQVLGSQLQLDVTAASTGRSGLRLVHDERPALVLLDIDLPDMDGYEVLARLRSDPATAGIPVIVTSATNGAHASDHALASGAIAFLPKPLDLGWLVSVVRDALSPAEARAA